MTENIKARTRDVSEQVHQKLSDASGRGIVLFEGIKTDLNIENTAECSDYIRDKIVLKLFKRNLLEDSNVCVKHLNKNSNIKKSVSELQTSFSAKKKTLVICSYGMHIQKMLSILEIFKASLTQEKDKKEEKASSCFQQHNKLACFTLVTVGRNELLDKKTSVPILVTVIASPENELDLEGFNQQ